MALTNARLLSDNIRKAEALERANERDRGPGRGAGPAAEPAHPAAGGGPARSRRDPAPAALPRPARFGMVGQQRGHAQAVRAGGARRRHRRAGAGGGRERHRQGDGGPGDPHGQRSQEGAARLGQLRGDPREPAGERAVRPRPRRLHRRGSRAQGALRRGPRRDAVPRRDRRHADADAGGPAARAAGEDDPPRGRPAGHQGRRAGDRRLQQVPGGAGAAEPVPRGPLLPAQRRHAQDPGAAAARRRHPAAGGSLPQDHRDADEGGAAQADQAGACTR